MRFGSDKWGGHWYTPHYERYFEPFRDRRIALLEIGIGGYQDPHAGGASLRMWKHFFRRGEIYGLDRYDKSGLAEPRVHTIQGGQDDADLLDRIGREYGPFDIVIDDGSHLCADVTTSFRALFPHVAPGGLYVVEDLQTSYWPGWGGNSVDLTDPTTSMGLLKTLLDGLHHREQVGREEDPGSGTELMVTGAHFHHNLAFLERGINTEQSYPPWVPRLRHPLDGS